MSHETAHVRKGFPCTQFIVRLQSGAETLQILLFDHYYLSDCPFIRVRNVH